MACNIRFRGWAALAGLPIPAQGLRPGLPDRWSIDPAGAGRALVLLGQLVPVLLSRCACDKAEAVCPELGSADLAGRWLTRIPVAADGAKVPMA